MGKGKNLKAALQSQQSRLKVKQKISHPAQITEQKGKKKVQQTRGQASSSAKGNGKSTVAPLRKPTIPFRATDKILLIGEGNFSFARALILIAPPELQSLPPSNITATAYDSEQACYEKYPEAEEIVAYIKEKGVEVLFGVDGTHLEKHAKFKSRRWDRVVWNFPHAGKGITDQDRNILSNQMLILGFLRSAAKLLALGPVPLLSPSKKKKRKEVDEDEDEDTAHAEENVDRDEDYEFFTPDETVATRGTILITLRNVPPYTLWNVPRLAKNPPPPASGSTPPNPRFILLRSFVFSRSAWNGYEHRMTKGERAHGTGRTGKGGEDRTWEFCLRDTDTDD